LEGVTKWKALHDVSVEVRTVLTAVERYRIDIIADNPKRVSRNLQNTCV